ncbi:5-formyltetrahydrofolate cyclo-ligase-like [Ornithodoros turicata]|uniref:5-formyltetrahydrofolate cyclo-ligase-like n=1 Tax=Ornithodoros turicata TaxID=34597 RepID=UPI003139E622
MSAALATAVTAAKSALRSEVRKKLQQLTQEEKALQSKHVCTKLLRGKLYRTSARISVYVSTDLEVNTEPIIEQALNDGKECFIPRHNENSRHMDMVKLASLAEYHSLPVTKWGIKQLSMAEHRDEALASGGLDLIIVPGVAFTKRGVRLGHGKGYYDMYLEQCANSSHGRPYMVGLSFKEQLYPNIPTHDHDFVLDEVLFPDE